MRFESMFKEQFSLAYVRAVAAVAGCAVTRAEIDVNGYDITIASTDDQLHPRLPRVDAQLKCTSREVLEEHHVVYDLDVPTYRKLRMDVAVPSIFIVVIVPHDPGDWLVQTEDNMTVHHCAYWRSLYDLNDTKNDKTERLRLPRVQVFHAHALRSILDRVNRGEKP